MLRFVNTRCNFKNYQIVCVPIGCSVIFLLGPKEKKNQAKHLLRPAFYSPRMFTNSLLSYTV